MGWNAFKATLLPQMKSNSYKTISDFARAFTLSYDLAVKSGKDTINGVPMVIGNRAVMEQFITNFLTQTQKSNSTTLLETIGPALIIYWTGGKMAPMPAPTIPSPGSIRNIVTTSGLVLNPGSWVISKVQPNNNPEQFLNAFINSAKIHLTTVSGIYSVIAQYPPPAPPAPGIVPWSGYTIPN